MANRRRIEARDAGLERLSKLTQAVLCGGFVASGVVAVAAAHSFAGHSAAASSPSVSSAGSTAVVDSPSAGVQGDDAPVQGWGAQPAPQPASGYVQSSPVPLRRWHTVSRGS